MADFIPAGLAGPQQDAYTLLQSIFESYGLGTLAPKIVGFLKQGYSGNTVSYLLQQTDEYKQRFAANQARVKNGLPALSPSQYLSVEASYKQVLQSAGLPAGFYDQHSDFNNFIANDVAPAEVAKRVQLATSLADNADQSTYDTLREYGYSVNKSDLAAYYLDPERALPILEKQARQVQIGAAAQRQGVDVNADRAMQLAERGVTEQQAAKGYGAVAEMTPELQQMAHQQGAPDYTQTDAENDAILGMASAQRKRRQLVQGEVSQFRGAGGAVNGSLDVSPAGSF